MNKNMLYFVVLRLPCGAVYVSTVYCPVGWSDRTLNWPKNNRNFCIKTELVVYTHIHTYICHMNKICNVASAPTMNYWVFMLRFRLVFGQSKYTLQQAIRFLIKKNITDEKTLHLQIKKRLENIIIYNWTIS